MGCGRFGPYVPPPYIPDASFKKLQKVEEYIFLILVYLMQLIRKQQAMFILQLHWSGLSIFMTLHYKTSVHTILARPFAKSDILFVIIDP